ncbi:MAG: 23S rRNA methyltransferase [Oscillospiraceae bacterium]|jgi:hypothetical protein|nr:23S rRNA methyltransferase [Oscillospiraceae bacterium]
MATYTQIQTYVQETCEYKPQTCWIAHVKELYGLPLKPAYNRAASGQRKKPCPPDKQDDIAKAFKHFGMI